MQKQLTAIFPGTFDPITNGHIDLITRASKMFANLIVTVAKSPNKKTFFAHDERINLAKTALVDLKNVTVIGYSNLMADFAKDNQASILIRGVRTAIDFEYERQLAEANHSQNPELETLMLIASQKTSFISSTIVKEIFIHQGVITNLVPRHVEQALLAKSSISKNG